MLRFHLITAAVIVICLAMATFAQDPMFSDEFALGVYGIGHTEDWWQETVDLYPDLKEMGFNLVVDTYHPIQFEALEQEDLYIIGHPCKFWEYGINPEWQLGYSWVNLIPMNCEIAYLGCATYGWDESNPFIHFCFDNEGDDVTGNDEIALDLNPDDYVRFVDPGAGHEVGKYMVQDLRYGCTYMFEYDHYRMRFWAKIEGPEPLPPNEPLLELDITLEEPYSVSWNPDKTITTGDFAAGVNTWQWVPRREEPNATDGIKFTISPSLPSYDDKRYAEIEIRWIEDEASPTPDAEYKISLYWFEITSDGQVYPGQPTLPLFWPIDGESVEDGEWDVEIIDDLEHDWMEHPRIARTWLNDEPYWDEVRVDVYVDGLVGQHGAIPYSISLVNPFAAPNAPDWAKWVENSVELTGLKYPIKNVVAHPLPGYGGIPGVPFEDYNSHIQEAFQGGQFLGNFRGDFQNLYSLQGEKKPWWFMYQVGNGFNEGEVLRCPTAPEVRTMANLALAYGAEGLMTYLYATLVDGYPWQVGYTGGYDLDFRHDTDHYDLDENGEDEWVFWQQNYDQVVEINRKCRAIGATHFLPLDYETDDRTIIDDITHNGDEVDINEKSGADWADCVVQYTEFEAPQGWDPDGGEYFMIVNRNTWDEDPYATIYYDIETPKDGTWILEDVYTHEFWKETGNDITFGDVPFEPGQGRLFRLAQTARWFGDIYVAFDMTVPEDITLIVDEGTWVKIAEGKKITVNGQLLAIGQGPPNQIGFQAWDAGKKWVGIEVDHTGLGQMPITEIKSCNISGAIFGIRAIQTSYLEIEYCNIYDNNVGIYGTGVNGNLNPKIRDNEIDNNVFYGIVMDNMGSDGEILRNNIVYNGIIAVYLINSSPNSFGYNGCIGTTGTMHGLRCDQDSSPYCFNSPNYPDNGFNEFMDNVYGVSTSGESRPWLGARIHGVTYGYNNIFNNSSYQLNNLGPEYIHAERNYWAAFGPGEDEIYNPELAYTDDWLSDPIHRTEGFFSTNPSAKEITKSPDDNELIDLLLQADELLISGEPFSAANVYSLVLSIDPSEIEGLWAVWGLNEANQQLGISAAFLSQLQGISSQYASSAVGVFADFITVNILSGTNPDSAFAMASSLAAQMVSPEWAMHGAFRAAVLEKYARGNTATGDSLFAEFIEKYPGEELANIARIELGTLSCTAAGIGEGEQITTRTPRSYTFDPNYPNPFNASTTFRFYLPYTSSITMEV